MQIDVRRRGFLALGAGGVAAAAAARWSAAVAASAPFAHGVASGDPLADRVILWTRVTPSADAQPGSGIGPVTTVTWEVAEDQGFTQVVAQGTVDTGPDRDHTVKVDAMGLRPGTDHWFRFRALGATSAVGHTRTASSAGSAAVRLGVVSCAHAEWGYFAGYRHLAGQDVDAVLHLGDYIYEYGPDGAVSGVDSPTDRVPDPPFECLDLADYRTRHGQYKLDPDLQALHAAHAVIAVWDDHEVANDAWREGAENHQPEEGHFATRAAAARQAWREWQPVREVDPAAPTRIHRRFRFGDTVDLWMLDSRQYRDVQPDSALLGYGSVDPAANDPDRTMLGTDQRSWLLDGIAASTAAWKVVGNQVPFFPLHVGAALPNAVETLLAPIRDQLPVVVPPNLYVDDWNGYQAERRALTAAMAATGDVVVLTGDVHESFVSDIPADPGLYVLTRKSVAVEFIVPAISSPSIARGINHVAAPAGDLFNAAYELNLTLANPWVRYHQGTANGYGVVEFRSDRTQCDLWHLTDATDPDSSVRVEASWKAARGTNRLSRASAALPPRA